MGSGGVNVRGGSGITLHDHTHPDTQQHCNYSREVGVGGLAVGVVVGEGGAEEGYVLI